MTYTIAKQIIIHNDEDGWEYIFTTDEYGTVSVLDSNGPTIQNILIPRDCIQHFIDALEQLK
jgi:hypothetical protein